MKFISLKLAIVTLSLGCLLHSCANENDDFIIKKEMVLLDSINQKMAILNHKLDIDYEEIKERIEEMDLDIMKMRMSEKEIPIKMAHQMERYVAIQKAYKNFYQPFKTAKTEAEGLNAQLITLRESVLKQEYGKEKFKEFYAQEQADINKLASFINKHIQPILNMEMEYRRIQSKIDQYLYGDELEAMKNQKK